MTSTPSYLLSLDLSTHTGWAYFKDGVLVEVGSFDVKIPNYVANVKKWSDLPDIYPSNHIKAADEVADQCIQIWLRLGRPPVVTEHTEGSKHRISQRTLEFIHYAVFSQFARNGHVPRYLLNSDWRKNCKCYISQWPDFQKWNKEVGKAKKKATPNKAGAKVAKIDGKIVSKWDAKKISIYIAKLAHPGFEEIIGTNDDIADAINLGQAAIDLKVLCQTEKPAAPTPTDTKAPVSPVVSAVEAASPAGASTTSAKRSTRKKT
jgi:hypothetical protein